MIIHQSKLARRIKTKIAITSLCLVGLSVSSTTLAQDAAYETTAVGGSIYMLSGVNGSTGGNVGVSIGDSGVAMIDNGYSDVLDILRAEVAKLTDKPVDYLINTHVHGDHTGNNTAFGDDGTLIISHDNLRANLVSKGIYNGKEYVSAPEAAIPVLTFADKMTLHINGDAAKIVHFAKAHTDGDAVIFFQRDNIIHTGDILFNKRFPYIDQSNGGSLSGVILALQGISELADDNTKIIPGHGPLANKSDLGTTIAMLQDSSEMVAKLIEKGLSDEQILAANPLEKYESYSWRFITTERMTKQLLANLR